MQPVKSYEELVGHREDREYLVRTLRELYGVTDGKDNVDRIDLMVGLFAEKLPPQFGFSDTAFRIFILMASRRLKSDRFFTDDFRPEVYTPFGIDWVNNETMASMLERHFPVLRGKVPAGAGVCSLVAQRGPVVFHRVARASVLDSLRFNLFHVLPLGLQGTLRKRPFWVRVVGRLHPDPLGARFIARLKAKYNSAFVDLRMLTRRTRLVLDPTSVRDVLDRSPDTYADPKSKRSGMSVFQPNAVTISRQPEWELRRRFNDLVLSAAVTAPLDDHFLSVVRDEVGRWHARSPHQFNWDDLQEIFDRVTLRVIFGDAAREDRSLLDALTALDARANRVLFRGRDRRTLEVLESGIRRHQERADPNSLVGVGQRVLRDPQLWPMKRSAIGNSACGGAGSALDVRDEGHRNLERHVRPRAPLCAPGDRCRGAEDTRGRSADRDRSARGSFIGRVRSRGNATVADHANALTRGGDCGCAR